jgi:hypothetical protein
LEVLVRDEVASERLAREFGGTKPMTQIFFVSCGLGDVFGVMEGCWGREVRVGVGCGVGRLGARAGGGAGSETLACS